MSGDGDTLTADVLTAVTAQAIVVLTADGLVDRANDAARRLHGCPADEIAGMFGPPLVTGPDAPIGPALRALTGGGTWQGDAEIRHASGRTVAVDLTVTHRPAGGFVLAYQPRAQAPVLPGGALLSKLGHELRSPLNGVVGLARILLRKVSAGPPDPESQTQQLTLLLASAGQMLRLIEQVVEVARLQSAPTRPAPVMIDCRELVAEAVRAQRPSAVERGLRLLVERPAEPVPLLCETAALDRILAELIGNAIRYTGGADIHVRLSAPGDTVRIEVADDGPAIPAGERERIFEAFERGEGADEGGAGLGLYLARELAAGLGAELSLRDDAEPGTTFVLDIPSPI